MHSDVRTTFEALLMPLFACPYPLLSGVYCLATFWAKSTLWGLEWHVDLSGRRYHNSSIIKGLNETNKSYTQVGIKGIDHITVPISGSKLFSMEIRQHNSLRVDLIGFN